MLCCFKNICKLYHSLGLILDLGLLDSKLCILICLNKCSFSLLLLLLYGVLLYDFGKFHFPFYFDGHLVCLQLLVIRNKGGKHGIVYIQAFSVFQMLPLLFTESYPLTSQQKCARIFISKASHSIKCCLNYAAGSEI